MEGSLKGSEWMATEEDSREQKLLYKGMIIQLLSTLEEDD